MNKNIALIIELALIALYLVLVIFVFDTSNVLGLILVGVATLVIFPTVLVIEKKREAALPVTEEATELPAEATVGVAGQSSLQSSPQEGTATVPLPASPTSQTVQSPVEQSSPLSKQQ